jgi:hypothetical protein
MQMVAETGITTMRVGDADLAFRTYLFQNQHIPVHVFFCVWEDRPALATGAGLPEPWTLKGRFEAVLRRERELGQQVLEVGIAGTPTEAEALAEFKRVLPELLRPDPFRRF